MGLKMGKALPTVQAPFWCQKNCDNFVAGLTQLVSAPQPRDSSEAILLGKLIVHCAIFTREFMLFGILMRYKARLLS